MEELRIMDCMFTQNDLYKTAKDMTPEGIVVHSTGCRQTWLGRFVQPSDDDPNKEEILDVVGYNGNKNSWNRSGVDKLVHYMIGLNNAETSLYAMHMLQNNKTCGGVYKGVNGSYNNSHIQFEMMEDGEQAPYNKDTTPGINSRFAAAIKTYRYELSMPPFTEGWKIAPKEDYFNRMMDVAINLCAFICEENGFEADVICSHMECAERGYGSSHVDPEHWLAYFGKTMGWFRNEVQKILDSHKGPSELDLLKEENKNLKDEIEELKKENKDLSDNVDSLNKSLHQSEDTISNHENTINKLNDEISELEDKNAELRDNIEEYKTAIDNYDNKIYELNQELEECRKETVENSTSGALIVELIKRLFSLFKKK